jgi:hypothetical protein
LPAARERRCTVIFLSEKLMGEPKEDALWTVAREIAHSHLGHGVRGTRNGFEAESAADKLAAQWGFAEPADRAGVRESFRRH